jgi:hypothetical protein
MRNSDEATQKGSSDINIRFQFPVREYSTKNPNILIFMHLCRNLQEDMIAEILFWADFLKVVLVGVCVRSCHLRAQKSLDF